ncbi:MAG: hypothetical protein FWF81_10625 [Defluviitaleaceae bacterium]|nr:hypothetical protein [Defluviitaleaceae bacterium]
MKNLSPWKISEQLQASGRRGVIIGICVTLAIIVAIILTIMKIRWLKKHFGCCGCDDFDDDFYIDEDDIAEEGYASEKDFS